MALGVAVVLQLTDKLVLSRDKSAVPAASSGADKSIAVLPFDNLSRAPDNAYVAIGMQDEILTRLSKIGALKVISRSSTMRIASKPENLPELARLLGVSAILEGSVQKAGDTVHINVQLILAATDEHLWAESYNRKLDDVFAVQGEVAQAVADALGATLTGAERQLLASKPTTNPRAYEFYLRRLAMGGGFTSVGNVISDRAAANQAEVDLDPLFAVAWARLAKRIPSCISTSSARCNCWRRSPTPSIRRRAWHHRRVKPTKRWACTATTCPATTTQRLPHTPRRARPVPATACWSIRRAISVAVRAAGKRRSHCRPWRRSSIR